MENAERPFQFSLAAAMASMFAIAAMLYLIAAQHWMIVSLLITGILGLGGLWLGIKVVRAQAESNWMILALGLLSFVLFLMGAICTLAFCINLVMGAIYLSKLF